jgi:hypothetical protein
MSDTTAKPRPPHILLIGKGYVIIAGTTEGEKKYSLVENALKFIGSFKEGDLVNFSIAGKDQIKKMWKVDENGEYKNKDGSQRNNQPSPPVRTLTIGGTINLENYENLKIEISGPFNSMEDAKKLQADFREVAFLFRGDMVTKGLIERYMGRVCGSGVQ